MRRIRLSEDTLHVGRFFEVDFQRTLRIPDDGGDYPLPPGLGRFPLRRVRDYARRVPRAWRETGGYFLPMYQREALWLSFGGNHWHPVALKVGIGGVDAISGKPFGEKLHRRPQDYVVVPEQPWLDGINAGDGFIRQFVAMPLGMGYTVEAQLTGEEETGGIQLTVVEPKPGRFPDRPPRVSRYGPMSMMVCESANPATPMGLGAGGRMVQKIYPDEHGLDTWDSTTATTVHVHIADSRTWTAITGEAPPPSPISAETYIMSGLPWFDLHDEHEGDVPAPTPLKGVKSLGQMDQASAEQSGGIADGQVVRLHL